MKIHNISSNGAAPWITSFGETYDLHSEQSFAAFETQYLNAYDTIIDELSKIASIDDDGSMPGADLSMSSWMDPSRLIGVVASSRYVFTSALASAIWGALNHLGGRFAIVLRKMPTAIYFLPGDTILIKDGSNKEDLISLGISSAQ